MAFSVVRSTTGDQAETPRTRRGLPRRARRLLGGEGVDWYWAGNSRKFRRGGTWMDFARMERMERFA